MLDDFFGRALVGGIGVALATGPLGCFMVWRRMAYFGDSVAHSALLGVVLGVGLGIELNAGIVIMCIALALLLLLLQQQRRLATDTLLGILAHGGLALGLVGISFLQSVRVDLMSYLFGDILAVTGRDLIWIYGGGGVVLAATALDMAAAAGRHRSRGAGPCRGRARGPRAGRLHPPDRARGRHRHEDHRPDPDRGAPDHPGGDCAPVRALARADGGVASAIGIVAVAGGLHGSLAWDTPSGPSIVVAALALFALGHGGRRAGLDRAKRIVAAARADH